MKKVWKTIITVITIIGGAIATFFIGKSIYELAVLGRVSKNGKWEKVSSTTVKVYDEYAEKYRTVKLPKDRRTGKQIKVAQVEAVGITNEGGPVNVQIKHVPVDRSAPVNAGGDGNSAG